ncbi:Lhr family helicase, partial [Pseudonocardia sp. D17]|uniref:Lhr family helicase n=1 Tax=Pseudonocardia sp. D17 TaxID=882661 RepID=UPI00403F364F
VMGVVEQLAGAPLPASALESLILPARLPGYSPALLDELTAAGEVTWTGCGTLAGTDGWLALAPADVADLLLPEPEPEIAAAPIHRALLGALGMPAGTTELPAHPGAALFFRGLADAAARTLLDEGEQAPTDDAVVAALWDLVWAGLVTNDTLGPLRARLSGGRGAHRPRRQAPRGRYAQLRAGRPAMPTRSGPPSVGGRWALATGREPDATRRAHARAEAFLERHGVLTRGALSTERGQGGFASVYGVLRAMEDSGRCRRGYVVDGLGAAQFAVPGAIDRLRALSRPDGPGLSAGPSPEFDDDSWAPPTPARPGTGDAAAGAAVVLAAADPAQPYGAALGWPATVGDSKHRPGRKAGALVVLVDGAPALYVERGGRSLLSFTDDRAELRAGAEALAGAVHEGWLGSLAVEKADGVGSLASDLAEVLTEAGFRVTPKGLRLRA